MPCGQGFGLALLVALSVLAASQAQTLQPKCDYSQITPLDFRTSQTQGRWYQMLEGYTYPSNTPVTGYFLDITPTTVGNEDRLDIRRTEVLQNRCENTSYYCVLGNHDCVTGSDQLPGVKSFSLAMLTMAADNSIAFFSSTLTIFNGLTYPFFEVYSRDPQKTLTSSDLEQFRGQLTPGCPDTALDPGSDFYTHQYTYSAGTTCA